MRLAFGAHFFWSLIMIFCDNKDLKIVSDVEPHVCARTVLPDMSKSEIFDIEKRPYLNKTGVTYTINHKGEEYRIYIPKGYSWDGATIPFGFRWIIGGKGNPQFLIPSCVHDKMCENKWLIDYNRELSSLIFKELLLACGCNKIKAQVMFLAVNGFQKTIRGWRK